MRSAYYTSIPVLVPSIGSDYMQILKTDRGKVELKDKCIMEQKNNHFEIHVWYCRKIHLPWTLIICALATSACFLLHTLFPLTLTPTGDVWVWCCFLRGKPGGFLWITLDSASQPSDTLTGSEHLKSQLFSFITHRPFHSLLLKFCTGNAESLWFLKWQVTSVKF